MNHHFKAMGSMNTVTQEQREHVASEGSHTGLSCGYDGSIYNVQWYRQQQGSRPEFLLYITETGSIHPTRSDFSADIAKTQKRGNLLISSAAVTDSAVYYCALQPTVTGNTRTLYKNLQYSTAATRGNHKPPLLIQACSLFRADFSSLLPVFIVSIHGSSDFLSIMFIFMFELNLFYIFDAFRFNRSAL
uniref:Ig-like domain-containing protein n=1 Tax=Poecilia mexicana TaxID=48701 RepID=A0A3B3YG04_9TELE